LSPRAADSVFLEEVGKESLCQILGVLRAVAFAADIGIKGKPVRAAKLLQRFTRAGCCPISRAQDDTPMGGGKPLPAPWRAGKVVRRGRHGNVEFRCSLRQLLP